MIGSERHDNRLRHLGRLLAVAALTLIAVFGRPFPHSYAASANVAPLANGDVVGFAWMGVGITNPNASEGGGGWLNFNCKATYCVDRNHNGVFDASELWGVTMDLNHSGTEGTFQGNAWSSNYGWLTFRQSQVSRCWTANPGVTDNTVARAQIENGGTSVNVVGWARFIAGDDEPDDGWDGCVAFSGANHSVSLDMGTGSLSGWAWGGPVVGWISFTNPECPTCNTSVVLDEMPTMTFYADLYTVAAGGGTTLHWTSTTTPGGNYVDTCPAYSNTSNYLHWRSTGIQSTAGVGPISFSDGNLPNGSHPVNGIMQTTTYEIHCKDRFGADLPAQFLTITVPVSGCTDPTSPNYDPLATVDDGSCNGGVVPTIVLNVITAGVPNDTLPQGSMNTVDYQTSPRWTFTNRDQIAPNSCQQSFADEYGVTQNVTGWTGATLANPPYPGNNPFDTSGNSSLTTVNIATYANDAPVDSLLTFTITCDTLSGGTVSASDTVRIVNARILPSLSLLPEQPTLIIGSGNYSEDLKWISSLAANLHACEPTSFTRDGVSESLAGWTNVSSIPDPETSLTAFNPPYTAHQAGFTMKANAVTTDTTFIFGMRCQDSTNGNAWVPASATIQMITTPIFTEPPQYGFWISNPDADGNLTTEQIPATGYDVPADQFTLKWQALNLNSCKAASEQFNASGAIIGEHPEWAYPQPVQDDGDPTDSAQVSKSFPILAPLETYNTIFYLVGCIPDDPAFIADPLNPELPPLHVCMSITGQNFSQCPTNGQGRVPSYIEI